VIEHVPDPVGVLGTIRSLLVPGGVAVISTPNAEELLLSVGSDAYRAFFYRIVHRYYFNAASLARAAGRAGFARCDVRFVQRFGFGNFVGWAVGHRPSGHAVSPLGTAFDRLWRGALEDAGRSDYLYAFLR